MPELPISDASVRQLQALLDNVPVAAAREDELQDHLEAGVRTNAWHHLIATKGNGYLHGGIVGGAPGSDKTNKAPDITRVPSHAPFVPPSPDRERLLRTIGAATAVTVLELKKPAVTLNDDDSRGQAANYGARLLVSQPWRPFAVVGLFNGCALRLMRCTPDEDDGCVLYESRLFDVQTEGALCLRYLHALLHGDPARLGWAPVTLTQGGPLHIVRKLGVGATSVVYEAEAVQATAAGPTHYAVKVMTRRSGLDRDLFVKEDRTLRNVRRVLSQRTGLLDLVPTPVALLANGRVMVQFPVGRPLGSGGLSVTFSVPLVELLRVLHAAYVHRDLRLPNILSFNGGPLLVDWGYAAPVGQQTVPAGALLHSPPHILQAAQQGGAVTPTGADDLRTLLRVCFEARRPDVVPRLDASNLGGAVTAWRGVESGPEWAATGAAAAEVAALHTAADGSSDPEYGEFAARVCELLA